MRKAITTGAALAALMIGVATGSAAQPVADARPMFAEPNPSPDGSMVAFSSGGDIWEVPAAGGTARLLVSGAATEARPIYSPDGSRIAFTSNRGGNTNLFVLELATGTVKRLTWAEANEQLDGWSPDGRFVYFTSSATDVQGSTNVQRVSASGGNPEDVSREEFLAEFQSAPSPDGQSLALVARGGSNGQWWRLGSSHIDQSELWLKDLAGGAYRPLLTDTSRHAWPMWSPTGDALFYMSDSGGAQNLWRMPLNGGQPSQLTRFTNGRVLYPSISRDGGWIVFERDFQLWRLDLGSGQAQVIPVQLRGAPAGMSQRRLNLDNYQRLALAPDGKKLAVIGRGEIFIAPADEGGVGQRITTSAGAERELVWSPDSKKLLYVTERGLDHLVTEYDVGAGRERVLTSSGIASVPSYSPDGKSIAYVQDDKQLRLITLATGADRLIHRGDIQADGQNGPRLAWSPDGRYIAFPEVDRQSFVNVFVAPIEGGEARPVSFLAHGQVSQIAWTADGKAILFDTAQRSEQSRIARVDLIPRLPKYQEDKLRDLFVQPTGDAQETKPQAKDGKEKAKAAPTAVKPVRIEWAGLRDRITLLPIGLNAASPLISADGKILVVAAQERGRTNFYSFSLDELAKEPAVAQPLTATAAPKRDPALTGDGKTLYFLEGGKVFSTPLESPKIKPLPINATMTVDFEAEKLVVFDEAWSELHRGFFDPKFNGVDWINARERYRPWAAGAANSEELWRATRLMIGELNASHLGIIAPPTGEGSTTQGRVGNLGLRFAAGAGLTVREVIPNGPAAIAGIKPGERITRVDNDPLTATTNLDALLEGKVGRRVVIGLAGPAGARDVVVQPVSQRDANTLAYRAWVNSRRAMVDRLSGGRLGYVHIPDMSQGSLDQLYLDLDAENQARSGVVVDIRNNNGGFINGYAIDVFARQNYLLFTPRDLYPLPSRQLLGQRALGKPTVLLTNESSLSDAEDFSEGYRKLGLGKIVGQPTAGWIIFTGNIPLLDGSLVRVPSIRIQTVSGEDMENNPRPVDIAVTRPLGETLAGRDAQLEAAVATLLAQQSTR